ncbi:MAG TPA: 5-deoxy-glucuronate isomerase [Pyrinomonadaceae bacterium]|jgi:5-deoxy-glucuronate isomerase
MQPELSRKEISRETCYVPATHKGKGRRTAVAPGETPMRNLHYGRITLDAGDEALSFETGTHETALVCLKGEAEIKAGGESVTLGRYDALYVPRDSRVEVRGACDLAELSAPVEGSYPLQVVRFSEVRENPKLHIIAGEAPNQRDMNVLIGSNVRAGRILTGVTFSRPGNWTSWPPHEHSAMLEEAYLYIDMPEPSFGIQLVYTDPSNPELVQVVREGDVVLMPRGYHPNVAAPGGQINFMWMMAAVREGEDRKYGVVNVQPEFAAGGSGLEAVKD